MIKKFFSSITKDSFHKIFFIFFTISLWSAINTDFNSFKLNFSKLDFIKIIDIFRFSSPYIFFLYLILFKKINFLTKNKFLNFILFSLLISFLVQSINLIILNHNINYLHLSFMSLFTFAVIINAYKFNYEKEIIITSGIIIFIYFFIFSTFAFNSYYKSMNLTLYGNISFMEIFPNVFHYNSPRSSGLSRYAFILLIPIVWKMLNEKKIKKINYFFYCLFAIIIYLTQSRINVGSYFILLSIIFILTILSKANFKMKITKIVMIGIFPFLLYWGLVFIKKNHQIFFQNETHKLSINKFNNNYDIKKTNPESPFAPSLKDYLRETNSESPITSGRSNDWKMIIKKNDNVIFGNGIMGDRHLINQSASNILIYNYASGGLFSVLIFVLLIIRSIFISVKILLLRSIKVDKDNILIISIISIICYLIIRAIAESSFAIFGVDFLIFFIAYIFIEKNYSKLFLSNTKKNK